MTTSVVLGGAAGLGVTGYGDRGNDMDAYMDGKDAFIKDAETQAVAWFETRER